MYELQILLNATKLRERFANVKRRDEVLAELIKDSAQVVHTEAMGHAGPLAGSVYLREVTPLTWMVGSNSKVAPFREFGTGLRGKEFGLANDIHPIAPYVWGAGTLHNTRVVKYPERAKPRPYEWIGMAARPFLYRALKARAADLQRIRQGAIAKLAVYLARGE